MSSSVDFPALLRSPLLSGLMLLIIWMPIPLGSNRVGYWSLNELSIGILMLAWLIQFLRGKRRVPATLRAARPLLVLLGVWCLYVLFQCLPLPASWVAWLSPHAAWLRDLTIHPVGADYWIPLSVNRHATEVAFGKSVAYLLLMSLVVLLIEDTTQLKRLALAVVVAGLLQAVIGLIDPGFEGMLGSRAVNGTFPNRNHLANLLTMAIAVGLGILLATTRSRRATNRRQALRRALDWMLSGKMLVRASLLLMAVAIVLTRSRMGNLAFFGGMTFAGIAMLSLSRWRRRGMMLLLGSMILFDVLVIGSMLGMDKLVERIEDSSPAAETRDEVARDTIAYWRDFPLFGSGLGTFESTYPRYKRGDVALHYRQAHNDYLQFGAESGVIGVTLLGCALLLSLWTALRVLRERRHPWALGIAFSLVMVIVATLIHASVEFNLRIFANAALLSILLPLPWIGASLPSGSGTIPMLNRSPAAIALAGAATLVVLAYLAWVSVSAGAALLGSDNERLLGQWERSGHADPRDVAQALRRQLLVTRLTPHSAQAKALLARLAWWQLGGPDGLARVSNQRFDEVTDQMLYALLGASRDDPGNGNLWTAILTTRQLQRRYDALFETALLRTTQLAPWETHIQLAVTRIGLSAWDRLANDHQRRLIVETISRGLRLDAKPMNELIDANGGLDIVCRAQKGRPAAPFCDVGSIQGNERGMDPVLPQANVELE